MMTLLRENELLLFWLATGSAISFVVTLMAIPWLVVRIPADYFSHHKRHPAPWAEHHPVVRWTLLIIKNLLGGILICMGLAMLFLPGQGILTILIGVMLLNFPGKYRLERRMIQHKPVLNAINWMRRRARKGALEL